MSEDGSLPVHGHVDEDKVFNLQSPNKIGPLPERKAVEVKVFDNVPKLRYSIRAWEMRGHGHFLHDGPLPKRWWFWRLQGWRQSGRWLIAPLSWRDRWHNFKAHCSMIRFRITDRLGLTKP
jgi:hypothetical protein